MAKITRTVNGKRVTFDVGETTSEFRTRKQAERISRRGFSKSEERRLIKAKINPAIAVQDVRKFLKGGRGERITVSTPDRRKKTIRTAIITGTPSGTIISTQFARTKSLAQKQAPLRPEQKGRVGFDIVLNAPTIRGKGGDVRKFQELRRKGFSQKVALNEAIKQKKKQDIAIAKVDLIDKRLNKFGDNYKRFVNNLIDKGVSATRNFPNHPLQRLTSSDFKNKTFRLVVEKVSKFLNPIIVGTEIAGGLEQFRVLREADIISPSRFIKKKSGEVVDAVAFLIRNDAVTNNRVIIAKLNNFTDRTLRAVKNNFNPNTPDGLANLITIGVFIRLDKIGVKVSGKLVSKAKLFFKNPTVIRTLKRSAISPTFFFTGAGARGGKIVSKSTKLRAPKKLGKGLKKGAREQLRKGRRDIAFTKLQPKDVKIIQIFETKRVKFIPEIQKRLAVLNTTGRAGFTKKVFTKQIIRTVNKVKKPSPPRKSAVARRIGRQQRKTTRQLKRAFKEGQAFVLSGNKLKTRFSNKSVAIKNINKGVNQSISGNQIVLQKVIRKVKVFTRQLSKKAVKSEKINLANPRLSPKTANIISKDLRPEKLFKDLIVPETQFNTGGFRKGIKEKLFNSLLLQKKALETQRRNTFKIFINNVNGSIGRSNKLQAKNISNIIKKLSSLPSLNDLVKFGFSKDSARKIDNGLRALSLLSFDINITSAIIKIVAQNPISRPKQIPISSVVVVSPIRPPTKLVKKPKKRKGVIRKVVTPVKKKPVPKKVVRRVKKPVRVKRVKKPVRRVPIIRPRFKSKKQVVNFIKRELVKVPVKFRPSLVAVVFNLRGKKPQFITGLEIRRIIKDEFEKKKKKLKRRVVRKKAVKRSKASKKRKASTRTSKKRKVVKRAKKRVKSKRKR